MKIKDLKEIIKMFDDEKDVIVFAEELSQVFEIYSACVNNGHLQLNAERPR